MPQTEVLHTDLSVYAPRHRDKFRDVLIVLWAIALVFAAIEFRACSVMQQDMRNSVAVAQ